MKQRKYILQSRNTKTDKVTVMDGLYPMTHSQACTMKSKHSYHPLRHIELLEVNDDYEPVKYTSN
mgnify:CR=1 FL=1